MLVSAVVCPHPPALVPQVSQGGASRLDYLRRKAVEAVAALIASEHDLLVCVGSGPVTRSWGAAAGGDLRPYGVDESFGGSERGLPLSLTIAAYLLGEAAGASADVFQSVAAGATPQISGEIGSSLASTADRVAMLVMGDGSAKRSPAAPGYLDPRAEPFDASVVSALAGANADALLALQPTLAEDLWVAGRPAWQVLAGAIRASGPMTGRVLYDGAPLGVGYFVVQLRPR